MFRYVAGKPSRRTLLTQSWSGPSEMADIDTVLGMIRDQDAEFVDLRFTDPRGRWHHVTLTASAFDEDAFEDGVMFDGSSIAGWKSIDKSDMALFPDPTTAAMDPFMADRTLYLICDVHEPTTGERYSRCPRSTARDAEAHLAYSGIGDTAYFGPEPEFFLFDDVRFGVDPNNTFFRLDDVEGPYNTGRAFPDGNKGHRPRTKGGYFPLPPVDSVQDVRSDMLKALHHAGVDVEKHHHEVAASQHELGIVFAPMTLMGDKLQVYRYVVLNVAARHGKTATFMPKPVVGDNGSGMHCNQSIWRDDENQFSGTGYADLSETALHYIGGIMKHARAINAFSNPSTNSYKRLVPGFEAPVLLAYSARNRSASCRIPHVSSAKARRVEVRFPDPTANPYLAFSAMLMAGLDGIENRIDPGPPMDKDLYALPPEELKDIPTVAHSLRDALEYLESDHEFLTRGDVFTKDQIDAYIELKMEEVVRFEQAPHPVEYDMYFSP